MRHRVAHRKLEGNGAKKGEGKKEPESAGKAAE